MSLSFSHMSAVNQTVGTNYPSRAIKEHTVTSSSTLESLKLLLLYLQVNSPVILRATWFDRQLNSFGFFGVIKGIYRALILPFSRSGLPACVCTFSEQRSGLILLSASSSFIVIRSFLASSRRYELSGEWFSLLALSSELLLLQIYLCFVVCSTLDSSDLTCSEKNQSWVVPCWSYARSYIL